MTRAELVEQLAKRTGLTFKAADSVVELFYGCIMDALSQGDKVEIRGFGSFRVREYDGYKSRNPRTGEPIDVLPKKAPFFKPGKELRNLVNRGDPSDSEG